MHVKFVRIKMKQTIIFLKTWTFQSIKKFINYVHILSKENPLVAGKTNPNQNSQTAQGNVLSPYSKSR